MLCCVVRVEIWTRNLDKDHIYSSSSALLPLISKKNHFLVNRHNLSHLCYVSDGEIHTTPTLCHPKREEGWSCLLCCFLWEQLLPAVQPPVSALFSFSFPAQSSPAPGTQAGSVSISFTTQDHFFVAVPFGLARMPSRLWARPEWPPPLLGIRNLCVSDVLRLSQSQHRRRTRFKS